MEASFTEEQQTAFRLQSQCTSKVKSLVNSYCFNTKIGWITLEGDAKSLSKVSFSKHKNLQTPFPLFLRAEKQIQQYLRRELSTFTLPLLLQGTTFQKRVWRAISKIPYGHSASYASIAIQIGSPRAARAIGMAANKNPFPIIIPCHRVIGSNGLLTGYVAGLGTKKKLLSIELKTLPNDGKNL